MKVYIVTCGIFYEDETSVVGVYKSRESAERCAEGCVPDGSWDEFTSCRSNDNRYADVNEWDVED